MTDTDTDLTTPEPAAESVPEKTVDEMWEDAFEPETPDATDAPVEETTPPPDLTETTTVAPTDATDTAPTDADVVPRKFSVKLDHEDREIDFDALLATDEGKAELKERYEKGYGFDRAVARARQEAQDATLKWFEARGYKPSQVPGAPGGWEVVGPRAATPATAAPEPAAKPDPADNRAELEHIATYGKDDDPAAQVKAIRRLSQLDAQEAVAKQSKEFDDWKAGQTRSTQDAQQQAKRVSAENDCRAFIRKTIVARAKSFEGPDQARQAQRAMDLAFNLARTSARDLDEVASVVNAYANDLDARKAHWRESLAKQTPTKEAPPSLSGTPSGATDTDPTEGLEYKEDADWDAAIDQCAPR